MTRDKVLARLAKLRDVGAVRLASPHALSGISGISYRKWGVFGQGHRVNATKPSPPAALGATRSNSPKSRDPAEAGSCQTTTPTVWVGVVGNAGELDISAW